MQRSKWAAAALIAGGAACALGSLGAILYANFFRADTFGNRFAESLSRPEVASYAAGALTDAALAANPDLIAARPLLAATAENLVTSLPFRVVAGRAARQAHRALFVEGARNIVLSLPDAEVLLRSALGQANPQLAQKVPPKLGTRLASISGDHRIRFLTALWRLGGRLPWLASFLLAAGAGLLLAAIWLTRDLRLGLLRTGLALLLVGGFLGTLYPLGRLLLSLAIPDPGLSGLARGLWSVYLGGLLAWAMLFGGTGIILTAGASSLFEAVDPAARIRGALLWWTTPPEGNAARMAQGLMLLVAGFAAITRPHEIVSILVVVGGFTAAFFGVRDLFRLMVGRLEHNRRFEAVSSESQWALRTAAVLAGVLILVAGWVWKHSGVTAPPPSTTNTCNGSAALCALRVDQVVFPGAHNAMSNQEISGWMFPHHQRGFTGQLNDGVRALLIDIHYGLPGAARIKTVMDAGLSRERLIKTLGQEGFDAAIRIRNRLVGVDEGRKGLYFCHGFCELGAYPVEPALHEIAGFLANHPEDVVLLIVEDYVAPRDLAAAFEAAGLAQFVYAGPTAPKWPTVGELVGSGQRLVVFLESGRTGVPWLRPAFEAFQETPYSFHKPEDFSCVPNRGGTAGALFLMNNWVETTPTPKPSNAAIVNAKDFLLERARRCAAERGHIPNIIAVDFYKTGDVVEVARILNQDAGAR